MEELAEPIRAQEKPSERKKRIFLVDDSADILMLSKTVLEMDDYEVFTATSGEQALSLLPTIEAPDLIILDMQLEDMTGIDLLKQMEKDDKKLLQTAPVIFFSGREEIPTSNAIGFIKKPFEIDSFLKSVRGFIASGVKHDLYTH